MPNHMFVVNFDYVNDVELVVSEVVISNRYNTPWSNTLTLLIFEIFRCIIIVWPVPLAALSNAWVCGRSPAEIVGSNLTGGMDICLLCVLSRGLCDELITRPEESYRLWCVVVCDLETSWMRRPWPTGGAVAPKKLLLYDKLQIRWTTERIG